MKDRLIELMYESQYEFDGTKPWDEQCADYLLDNGVIVPPVNTGDTIYSISTDKLNELKVESISATMYHDRINIGVHATNYRGAFLLLEMCDFGKTVFLTREEAEQALKGD